MTTEINQEHIAGLQGAASTMIGGSARNMGQLLGVPVEFTLIAIGNAETQIPETSEEGIQLSVEFDGALTGDSWLVMSQDDARAIVRIMTAGMGVADDDLLGELGMSALSEAMNQLMAGAATALSDGLGERIDISPPTISTNPRQEAIDGNAVVVTYQGQIDGQARSKVYWKIDRELADSLGSRWLAAHGGAPAAEPVPTTAAPPAAVSSAPVVPAPTPPAATASAGTGQVGGGVINSVELDIAVELGNVAMTIGELLHMGEGSVVTLTQTVGDKVVMLANGTPVASGDVVIVDGTLGFRVADLITEAKGA
jgi:flagellar motor switch protein FliN/FliY